MQILCLNCGSSSAKYTLFDWDAKMPMASGVVERVGADGSSITHEAPGREKINAERPCPTHKEAVQLIIDTLTDKEYGVIKDLSEIKAVGHRILHGGAKFTKSVIINNEVIEAFRELFSIAPLHNPANVQGILASQAVMPGVPNMAILDTAWHQTMPEKAFMYALPRDWYEKYGVRRYGFHGTSFLYVAKRAAVLLGQEPLKTNLVICHIGNGASCCAVKDGVSVDTSMGFVPTEGLVMGTRSGDVDPSIPLYLEEKENLSAADMTKIINKKSGILGITRQYSDRRDVEINAEKGDKLCQLAIDMECYRIKKYIGAYMAAIGRTDAIVFTAGVGEMGPIIREGSLKGLENFGIKIDPEKNRISKTRNAETLISTEDSKIKVFVIPTDEERVFVEDVAALLEGKYDVHTHFEYTFQKKDYVNKLREEALKKQLQKKPELAKIIVRP